MLCYRFMLSNKITSSSYLKFYDAEIIPLLLRKPAATAGPLLYSTLQCPTTTTSVRRHKQEQEFIRSSRYLFHTSSLQSLKEKDKSSNDSSATSNPPPPAGTASHEQKDATATVVDEKKEIPLLDPEIEKLGLFARFKKMYKEYWYVLLPVHIVTSAGWLGGFYYLSVSGFDVATLMESWHFNDMIVSHLRDSKLGHVAIAYFLYKCFTPIRYMVTLGGTTLAIKNLSRLGYIRPVPTKDAFMKMYQDRKDSAKQALQKKTHGGSNSI